MGTLFDSDDALAALRLADDATEDWDTLGRFAHALLAYAPESQDDARAVEMLLAMHRGGALVFQVSDISEPGEE